MSKSSSDLYELLLQLSEPIAEALSKAPYAPSQSATVSVKALLEPLLPRKPNPNVDGAHLRASIRDFTLACALLSASQSSSHELLTWIPEHLAAAADRAVVELSGAYSDYGERGGDGLVAELTAEVMPVLKERIKESSIDKSADGDEVTAASARVPVGYAIVAAYQFRWFVTQIDYSRLGKLCALAVPCGLTALDHWSPEVKGQGMISFIHIAKSVDAAELAWCQDAILDACCQNMASSDEIWHLVVEMSVLVVTRTQQSNPRSAWFDKILNEMLSHLERQPRNKERRVAWLRCVEPLFNGVGLVLLAHFRRIFPLFFKWVHADDDETVSLVLKQIETVIKLTWIRNTPYVERLVDELATLHKEAAMKRSREEIRNLVSRILILLHQCKGLQFEAAWGKHRDDPNLATIAPSLSERRSTMVAMAIQPILEEGILSWNYLAVIIHAQFHDEDFSKPLNGYASLAEDQRSSVLQYCYCLEWEVLARISYHPSAGSFRPCSFRANGIFDIGPKQLRNMVPEYLIDRGALPCDELMRVGGL